MKDVKGFSKLFNINIPVDKYLDYYIDLHYKSGIDDIYEKVKLYEERESLVEVSKEKGQLYDKFIDLINKTVAYENFN